MVDATFCGRCTASVAASPRRSAPELPAAAARPTTVAAGLGWVVDGNVATDNASDSKHDIVQVTLHE